MLSKRSIKERLILELSVTMTVLLIVPILMISLYFSYTLKENIKEEMNIHANYIFDKSKSQQEYDKQFDFSPLENISNYRIHMFTDYSKKIQAMAFNEYKENGITYIELIKAYPGIKNSYLSIRRNIESETQLIDNAIYIILSIFFLGFLLILLYSNLLMERFMLPLKTLTQKFSKMDESILEPIKIKDYPEEYEHLARSFNMLITKIQTFVSYRKELYVGMAHELKTPLAVMRLKNQITLMKYKKQKEAQKNVKDALQQNIDSIDTLNAMIHNILEYGRAEGAQFEKPERVDLIRFLASKCEEYELLAQSKNRSFIYHFSVPAFRINLPTLLFMQILQNFVQNALRFTPEQGLVSLKTKMDEEFFIIEVIDEGIGIEKDKDLFAPFQRSLDSTGAGLGLFLAKNAAQSMGVIIDLKNREDISGAIASIKFPLNIYLLKD